MRISFLEEFVDLVSTGSFSKSAKRFHITQPSLSKHMKSLEEAVGVQLLDRDSSGVRLTAAGESFYRDVVPVVSDYYRAVEKAAQSGNRNIDSIRLGYFYEAGKALLRPIRNWYAKNRPRTMVAAHAMDIDVLTRSLYERKLDVIIIPDVESTLRDACDSLVLRTSGLVFATSWSNRLAQKKSVTYAQIGKTSLNMPDPGRWPALSAHLETKLSGASALENAGHAKESSTLFDLIEEGRYSAVVADYNCDVHAHGISYVPIADDSFTMDVCAFWLKERAADSSGSALLADFRKAAASLQTATDKFSA